MQCYGHSRKRWGRPEVYCPARREVFQRDLLAPGSLLAMLRNGEGRPLHCWRALASIPWVARIMKATWLSILLGHLRMPGVRVSYSCSCSFIMYDLEYNISPWGYIGICIIYHRERESRQHIALPLEESVLSGNPIDDIIYANRHLTDL